MIKNINNRKPAQRFMALVFSLSRGHFHILQQFTNLGNYENNVDEMISMVLTKASTDD